MNETERQFILSVLKYAEEYRRKRGLDINQLADTIRDLCIAINLYVPSFHRGTLWDKIINLLIDIKELNKNEIEKIIDDLKG